MRLEHKSETDFKEMKGVKFEKAQIDVSNFFLQQHCQISGFNFFLAYFGLIPNLLEITRIDCNKAKLWFDRSNAISVLDYFYSSKFNNRREKPILEIGIYILSDRLVIEFDAFQDSIRFFFSGEPTSDLRKLLSSLGRFKRKSNRLPTIGILVQSMEGLDMKTVTLKTQKLNLEDNYNEDFIEVHQTILRRLSKPNERGLVLLHGKPGTGKSSYIKHLMKLLKKDVIFLPTNLAVALTNPEFLPTLINFPNSILIIEDAENLLVDREMDGHSAISGLLNISDGILSDCLNMQIICTFNTDLSKIDSALLRKGRLIAQYEFSELSPHKTYKLAQKLGIEIKGNPSLTLAEIYNYQEQNFAIKNKKENIGFKIIASN